MDFDCACRAHSLYFHNNFPGEFRSPSFYKFWGGKYTLFYKRFCQFLFMYNIERVHIELLVPFDVLQTCAICVIVCLYVCNCVWLTYSYFPTLLRVEGYQMGCAPGIL